MGLTCRDATRTVARGVEEGAGPTKAAASGSVERAERQWLRHVRSTVALCEVDSGGFGIRGHGSREVYHHLIID